MTPDETRERFNDRRRGRDLPFVRDDEIEIVAGLEVGRRGIVDLRACAESPMQSLVDFGDGTDEYFPASVLKLLERAP